MNRKLYWVIRKYWRKCDFYIKRLTYTIREKLELHHNLAQVQVKIVKTMILQICSSLLLAFLLAKCDGFLMDRFSLKPLLTDIVKDITIGGMGIAGVILGLYCANIASIFSAKYSNVPQNLARLFQQDIVTNSCIKQIVGYIVFCTIILLECAVGLNLYLMTMIGLLLLTIRVVVTFSLAGNRSYVLSDTFSIADIKFRDLYNTVKNVSKHDLFTTDRSFQNHYRKVAANDISILREIGHYNMSIPRNQNRTMLLFMEKMLAFVELYWENKSKISFDSLWFDKKAQYQQWHLASDSEIRIALNTGTSIQPKERQHTHWFEEELLKINQECIEKFLKDDDVSMVQRYLINLCTISQTAGEWNQDLYWIHYLESVEAISKPVICRHLSNDDIDQEIALSAVDILCSNFTSLIVGINRRLSQIDIEELLQLCTTYSDWNQCDIQSIPYLNTETCRKLYIQINAELSIEKIRITPDWYIKQTVASEIYKSIGTIIDSITAAIKSVFDIGQQLQNEKYEQAAATALSHVFEILNKCRISIRYIEEILPRLKDKHIEDSIIWEEVSTALLHKEIKQIEEKLPAILIKCSVHYAVDHWKNREDSPDFLGLCYNHISEALIRSIERDDFQEFQEIYKDYFGLVLLYQEYVRTDVIKHKEEHMAGIVFHVATAPFAEYALISGLAIIWGEFKEENCWKDLVDSVLQRFVEQDEGNKRILQIFAKQLQARQRDILGIGNRDILQTGWTQRIEHSISESPKFETEYDHFSERLKTDSKLLSEFCGSILFHGSVELHDSEDVYMIVSVNKYLPDDQKYQSRSGWERDYES